MSMKRMKVSLSSVEPKASFSGVKPKVSSLFSKNLLYKAASLDSLSAFQALKYFKEERCPPVGLAALVPVPAPAPAPANITTKQKIEECLRTRNFDTQLLSLEEFLSCLDLQCCLNELQGKGLEELMTLSFEEMVALGIRMDRIVRIQRGIRYLMDLHNENFNADV